MAQLDPAHYLACYSLLDRISDTGFTGLLTRPAGGFVGGLSDAKVPHLPATRWRRASRNHDDCGGRRLAVLLLGRS